MDGFAELVAAWGPPENDNNIRAKHFIVEYDCEKTNRYGRLGKSDALKFTKNNLGVIQ